MAPPRTLLASLLATAALLGGAVAVSGTPPARAESHTFAEADTSASAIARVRVAHGPWTLRLRATPRARVAAGGYSWYVDTDEMRPGPEFYVSSPLASGRWEVHDFLAWPRNPGEGLQLGERRCDGTARTTARGAVRLAIPRACLHPDRTRSTAPRAVRLAVELWDDTGTIGRLPAPRGWSGWVRSGRPRTGG